MSIVPPISLFQVASYLVFSRGCILSQILFETWIHSLQNSSLNLLWKITLQNTWYLFKITPSNVQNFLFIWTSLFSRSRPKNPTFSMFLSPPFTKSISSPENQPRSLPKKKRFSFFLSLIPKQILTQNVADVLPKTCDLFRKNILDPPFGVLESFLLPAPLIPFLKDANQNFPKPSWISFLRCVEKISHRPAWFLFPKCCWISPKNSVFSFQEFPRWIPSRIQSIYFICHLNSS